MESLPTYRPVRIRSVPEPPFPPTILYGAVGYAVPPVPPDTERVIVDWFELHITVIDPPPDAPPAPIAEELFLPFTPFDDIVPFPKREPVQKITSVPPVPSLPKKEEPLTVPLLLIELPPGLPVPPTAVFPPFT
jgi:hypothetical protein